MDNKPFGIWFAETREKAGFKSQRSLALVADVANSTIARIESGAQIPEPDTLKKLHRHLKIPYEDLMAAAGYLPEHNEQDKITDSLSDDPELAAFWSELKEREDLQLFFKQTKSLSPADIKKVMRIIKAIEDEEAGEDSL